LRDIRGSKKPVPPTPFTKPKEVQPCTRSHQQEWEVYPISIKDHPIAPMTKQHPDAPKQFGIRLSDEIMELVSEIQEFRERTNQPTTLSSIVEDAISVYHDRLVEEGAIYGQK
jgi:hypothetical protein